VVSRRIRGGNSKGKKVNISERKMEEERVQEMEMLNSDRNRLN
jgi:hypothetical protein